MATAKECYEQSTLRMFEKQYQNVYEDYKFVIINQVLAELFNENNMARMFKGLSPLETIPTVSTNDDVIPYEDEYVYDVIPKGIDAYFSIDDDLNRHQIYEAKYNNARVLNLKYVSKRKIDALSK